MALFVTTQSYRNDVPTEHGILFKLDQTTGVVMDAVTIDTPVSSSTHQGERMKPGLRGLFEYQGDLFVATWNTVHRLDARTLQTKASVSHKWMSDLHGIHVDEQGIWVTSSLPDALILYDFDGQPKASLWVPETRLYRTPTEVDKEMDWSQRGKQFRGFHEFHANHVTMRGKAVYLTGRSSNNGRVVAFEKEKFVGGELDADRDIRIFAKHLYGPHDGFWCNESFFLTETLSSTLAELDKNGKVLSRRKIQVSDEEVDPRQIPTLRRIRKRIANRIKGRPSFDKTTHWTRGLSMSEERWFVGQSTWAGDSESEARVVVVCRSSGDILGAFPVQMKDYPEVRIFQVLLLDVDDSGNSV